MRISPVPFVVAILVLLTACQPEPASPGALASVDPAATAKRAALSNLGEADLRAAASKAIREQRIYSPAGDNAIEIYVALRSKFPADDAAQVALLELEPYAVIATEQSLQRDDLAEATRLIALIKDADPDASALPRLRDDYLRREKALALAAAAPVVVAEAVPSPVAAPMAATPAAAMAAPAAAAAPASVPAAKTQIESPVAVVTPLPVVTSAPAPAPASVAVAVASAMPLRQPTLVRDVAPRYPAGALRRGIEGSVELAFTIGADGSVNEARVVRGSPAGTFDEAALAVTRLWKFEATGQAVPGRRTIAFNLPKPAP